MPFPRPNPRFALAAAALVFAPAALAAEPSWLVLPEPMGGRAQALVEEAGRAASAEDASRVVGKAVRLPAGQGVSVLEEILRRETMPVAAKEAVLKALAEDANCPVSRSLANTVLLSVPKNAWTRPELWQRALRRFDLPEVVKALSAWARDPALPFEQRSAAIRALGGLPSPAGLEFLLSVREGEKEGDWAFRDDASRALMEMFCLSAPPSAEQIAKWRQLAARRDPVAINLHLKDRLAERVRAGQSENAKLVERIVRQEEELYVRAATDDQPAILARMLADPDLSEVRLKALELVNARIEVNRPVAGALLEAVRACVDKPQPLVRSRSVNLLQTLGDEPGAKTVARRLAAGAEDTAEVLAPMARLMRRFPQPEALGAVRRLLDHPSDEVGAEAAAALSAYDERGLLDAPTKASLAQAEKDRLRRMKQGLPTAPQHVLLLGRALPEADAEGWTLVAARLSDPAAREAAALAIESSTQPLAPLLAAGLAEGADAKLTEIAYRAVARRGASRADADALAARMPSVGALRDAWADALVGWASRAAPADVKAEARAAVKNNAPRGLAVRMLGKALAAKDLAPAGRASLLVGRAELLEDGGDLAAAVEDLDNAFSALDGPARKTVLDARVRLRLAQGQAAAALAACAKFAAEQGADPAMLKDALAQVLPALEKEAGGDAGANADKRAAILPGLRALGQALAGKSVVADQAAKVDALVAKWAPPEPKPEPKPPTDGAPKPEAGPSEGEKPADKPPEVKKP